LSAFLGSGDFNSFDVFALPERCSDFFSIIFSLQPSCFIPAQQPFSLFPAPCIIALPHCFVESDFIEQSFPLLPDDLQSSALQQSSLQQSAFPQLPLQQSALQQSVSQHLFDANALA
jgi:hypothetical protein